MTRTCVPHLFFSVYFRGQPVIQIISDNEFTLIPPRHEHQTKETIELSLMRSMKEISIELIVCLSGFS